MKRFLTLIIFFACCTNGYSQAWRDFKYKTGDLVFQDIDCDLCEAIETVTPGIGNKHFSHIGMVYALGDSVWVIEAIGKNVHLTPINEFLTRQLDKEGNPKVVVGRLKKAYQKLNSRAVGFALQKIGMLYDDVFIYNNGKYYCSELVYDAYKEANDDKPFFNLYPMTFKNPRTQNIMPAWRTYYKKLGMPAPEGKQGCNPGSIAISDNIDIISSFY